MATFADFLTGIEADKDLLLTRVDQLVFVDGVAGFECGRCGCALIRHYIANCGHKYCVNCRKVLTESKSNCTLPECSKPIQKIDLQDFEFEQKLYKLQAYCPNKIYGCPFVSQLKDLGTHLRMCSDTRQNALPVLIDENKVVEAVFRELSGKFDRLNSDVNRMSEETNKSFEYLETKMENNWKAMKEENETKMTNWNLKFECFEQTVNEMAMVQDMMSSQSIDKLVRSVSEEQDIFLSVASREDIRNRITPPIENASLVMATTTTIEENKRYTDEKILELNNRITKMEEITEYNNLLIEMIKSPGIRNLEENGFNFERYVRLKNLPQMDSFTLAESKSNNNFQPELTWKISGFKNKMKQLSYEIKSEEFEWTAYPVRSQVIMLVALDGNVRVSLALKMQSNEADLKLIPHVYYLLKDQSKTNNPQHVCRSRTHLFSSVFDHSLDFESFLPIKSLLNNSAYNVDDSILFEMYVEPPATARSIHSNDGTLDWAVENYWRRKIMVEKGVVLYHESPCFYTGPRGYRVRVRMELELSLSAQVLFLPGEFDADLSLTYPHRTTITLFHRKDPRRNIVKVVNGDIGNDKGYCVHLCIGEEMKNFVINDSLFYKVTIKPLH